VQATSSFQRRSGTSHANRAPPITAPTPCAATWRVVGDLAARIERDLAALLEHPAQLLAPALHARLHARATLPELRLDWRTVAIRSIAVGDEVKALLSANDLPIDDLDDPAIRLYGAFDGGRLVGVVGLRSLAVASVQRDRGLVDGSLRS
jgi:hypothetical protein